MNPLPVAQLTFTIVPTTDQGDAAYDVGLAKLVGLEKHLLSLGRSYLQHHLPYTTLHVEYTHKMLAMDCLRELVDALNETMAAPEGTRAARLYEALDRAEKFLKGEAT